MLLVTVIVLGLGQRLTGTEAILYHTPRIVNECVGGETEGCVSAQMVFLISIGVGACKLVRLGSWWRRASSSPWAGGARWR